MSRRIPVRCSLLPFIFVALVLEKQASGQHDGRAGFPSIPYDHQAIRYDQQAPNDRVAKLQQQLETGKVKLAYDPQWGYLPDLLKKLDVRADSQTLVFSKTSFQAPRISPAKPRALYFSDDVYIGSVQGGDVLEIVAQDPRQGSQFYTLDVSKTERPFLVQRGMDCLQCHSSAGTFNTPGPLLSSTFPGVDGVPRGGQEVTDHRTPLTERWGGWYVTGTSGELRHRGNAVARDRWNPRDLELSDSQNLLSLDRKFNTSPYLAKTSDIVALMAIEHQAAMTNLITRFGWEERVAQADGKLEEFKPRLAFGVNEIVSYMLFADEAKIYAPITGNSTFTKSFAQRGPRDRKGRSLRDFDLKTRLFRYPLSYMIYSEVFDAMPDRLRDGVYQKLYGVLTNRNADTKFEQISREDRQSMLEILLDTKPSLPEYWRKGQP